MKGTIELAYTNNDFKEYPSYEKETGIPIFSVAAEKKYATALENVSYYTNDEFGIACKLVSQLKYRGWTLPDLELIKGGVVNSGAFSSWQKRAGRDEDKIDTFISYAIALNKEKIPEMWKQSKLKQPISICCLAIAGGTELKGTTVSASNLLNELKSSKLGEVADIMTDGEIISSTELYNSIEKYETKAYEAFKTSMETRKNNYTRESFSSVESDEFMCIPIYVRCKTPGLILSDVFFSTRSELTKIDSEKFEKKMGKKDQISVLWPYCFPAEAIPEVGRLIKLQNRNLSKVTDKIDDLCEKLSKMDGNIYIDIRKRGSEKNVVTVDRTSAADEDFLIKLKEAMIDTLYDGGGYCFIINDVPGIGIKVYGLAFDCLRRWDGIPVDYMKDIYKLPVLVGREFSQYDMDYVDYKELR